MGATTSLDVRPRRVGRGAVVGLLALVLLAGLPTACTRRAEIPASPVNIYEQWPPGQASGSLWGYIREVDIETRAITFGVHGKWMSNEIEHRIDVDVPLPVELQLEDGSTADFWTQVKQEPGSVISEGDERRLIELQFASDGDGMTATALVKWADWPASTKEQESLDPLPWMRQVPGDERTYEVTGSVLQARPDNPRALQVLVFSEDDGVSVTHVFHVLLWDTSKVSSVDGTPMSEAEFTQTLRAVPAETTWTVVFSVEAPGLLVQSIAPTHKAD